MFSVPVEIRLATTDDHDDLFAAFEEIVAAGDGFPQTAPVSRAEFNDYWIDHSSAVFIARMEEVLVGAYYLKPNFVGKAAHIANAGYFVLGHRRGDGIGRSLVEHSLGQAKDLGFDALQFNLVFASNPARNMYRQLGFQEIGRIPHAVDGEDAVIYWRSLDADTL